MRVVDMTSDRYTAYMPEGILDRWALRRMAKCEGFEFAIVPLLAQRDFIVGASVDWPGRALGTCFVKRWKT